MKANPDKCHLLLSKNENFEANINGNRISNTTFEKLLGVAFDNQLNFNHHISKICKTASSKIQALARVLETSMRMKGEYFSIRTFHRNLIIVPSYG